jgi:transcriptional regulator with XRE-family HTH domain
MVSNEAIKSLTRLGHQLRELRLERNDRQSDFAARLGVSIPTLRKLEQGDPTVAIGTWIDAVWLVGRLDQLTKVLEPTSSLFDQWEEQHKTKARKRATKK